MKKIVTIVGARPQFIKVAPVSRELRKSFQEVLVDTGQHYDYKMAGIFFEELKIPKPDYNLGVGSGTHGKQTGEMLSRIEEVLLKEKPDAVLVYGDTNSTIAGALAASKLHIPLFHIEAGLRSYNKKMPEEVNRVLTDHISNLLLAPTDTAIKNLEKEGIVEGLHQVGDVMYDAFLYNLELANRQTSVKNITNGKPYYLATFHRAENTDMKERLEAIFSSLKKLREQVILPLHPRTEKKLKEFGLYDSVMQSPNIKVIEPVSYLEMILLEKDATGIITDSGGVQKEAFFANVPCFTLRDQTEWVETVNSGWNRLVNPILEELHHVIHATNKPNKSEKFYGNGQAAFKISKIIDNFFQR
ncbi:UDP-N-acetylglucosamine 2-epimerase (non-hydrolyzing)/UDP-GlcNAc3NAcA epimerase [Evansella vedderi]|uniref:UDP-N-acetylglucosamine 2-epimerase (Non-hydrolyzing)/UDP-GlcNAc3NAcA epimerase n=1 Tax=Evansella vedderi TaxID=38282 RepID=A0ABT9ZUT2_9BACI|nr:UDP-N-acetylglucosamine 2-epimerase (non-hydrolyzing) [Evansella vedderi]MDQ0254471.1 UDP-N-acetylglucosamine 2-epimerase (non-hydrolyzing)/UDP-GlcNAc3NAcA epimerase [Evansella vedderi]